MTTSGLSISTFRAFVLSFGVAATVLYYLFQIQGVSGAYFSTAVSTLALIIVLFALGSLLLSFGGGPQQFGFRFIFIGVLFTTVGELLWLFFTLNGQPVLAGSIPPIFYITTYVLNFLGYLKISIYCKIRIKEFLGIVLGFGIFELILFTLSRAINPTAFDLVHSGYVLGDGLRMIIISLILQMVIIYQGGLIGRYWLSIFIGNLFIIIGNFISTILLKEYNSYTWPFPLIDLIFIGGYLFVAHGFYGIGDSIRLAQRNIVHHRK